MKCLGDGTVRTAWECFGLSGNVWRLGAAIREAVDQNLSTYLATNLQTVLFTVKIQFPSSVDVDCYLIAFCKRLYTNCKVTELDSIHCMVYKFTFLVE